MSLRDRIFVHGTRITLVFFKGPPQLAWVVNLSEAAELVECILDAMERAHENQRGCLPPTKR